MRVVGRPLADVIALCVIALTVTNSDVCTEAARGNEMTYDDIQDVKSADVKAA